MGIGKDSMLAPVKQAVGDHNFKEVSPTQMLGQFNSYVQSVILRVSEARDLGESDRFAFFDHTKTIIAAPPETLRCNEKFLREHQVFNCVGLIITTNHLTDGIYLPADDRRHFVAWSQATKDDLSPDYWNGYWRWLGAGGNAHVAAYLRALDLSSFDSKAPPPKTPAFDAIVTANAAPDESELRDVLDRIGNPEALTLQRVVAAAPFELAGDLKDRKNRRALSHRFERAGYLAIKNPDAKDGLWVINGARAVIYSRADLDPRQRVSAARSMVRSV